MAEMEKLLDGLVNLDGALGAALVDARNGMLLYGVGSAGLDVEIAAAAITDVLRANIKMLKLMATGDEVEDILITLGKQYHILRPVRAVDGVFVYTILDRRNGNLALARRKVTDVEEAIVIL